MLVFSSCCEFFVENTGIYSRAIFRGHFEFFAGTLQVGSRKNKKNNNNKTEKLEPARGTFT